MLLTSSTHRSATHCDSPEGAVCPKVPIVADTTVHHVYVPNRCVCVGRHALGVVPRCAAGVNADHCGRATRNKFPGVLKGGHGPHGLAPALSVARVRAGPALAGFPLKAPALAGTRSSGAIAQAPVGALRELVSRVSGSGLISPGRAEGTLHQRAVRPDITIKALALCAKEQESGNLEVGAKGEKKALARVTRVH